MAVMVREIRVMAGDLVDHIEFVLSDGSRSEFGKRGGRLQEPFRLRDGEKLTTFTSRCGDSQDGCSFTTSAGRTSEWFGGHGGMQRVHTARLGHHIVGLQMAPGSVTQRVLGIIEASDEAAPSDALAEPAVQVDATTQQRVLSVQCALRQSLQTLLLGDEVQLSDGSRGCVRDLHEDRTGTIARTQRVEVVRPLLRDVTLISPASVGFPHMTTVRDQVEMLSWSGSCQMDASGSCIMNGRRTAHDDREGVHFKKLVATSAPIPEGIRVVQVSFTCEGMDQGWGNTGDAGVHVSAQSPGDVVGDERVLIGVIFDRRRVRGRRHHVEIQVSGAAGPQAGDILQVWLKCPNYPGWSSDCSAAAVVIGFERDEPRQGLGNPYPDALKAITETAQEEKLGKDVSSCFENAAFRLLWERLGNDRFLKIDPSHLSLSGLRRQACWEDPKEEASNKIPTQTVLSRIASLLQKLRGDVRALAPAVRLARRLEQNEPTGGAPQDETARKARYDQILRVVSRTLDGLVASSGDKWPPPLAEQVMAAYADAEPHCLYRWEREVHMCHDLICGDAGHSISVEAMPLEDIVLRVLHGKRRRIAEAALHRAKGQAGNSDMHFDSYFYANVHFGVIEQRDALLDPNRLNYAQLSTGLDFAKIQAELADAYTPAHIRSFIREELVESKAEGAEAIRGKLYDTLRAATPAGFQPSAGSSAARQEAWLFEQCHDDSYKITDTALNLLLCRLRVFSGASVADLFRAAASTSNSSGAVASGSRVRLLGLQARQELNGKEGVVMGRKIGQDGAERWEVRLETGGSIAVRASNLEVLSQSEVLEDRSPTRATSAQDGRRQRGSCARRLPGHDGGCALH